MKRIYNIILVLLLSLMGRSMAYALSTSGDWAQQTISTNTSVTLVGDVLIKGPIIIKSGVTLEIYRKTATGNNDGNIRIKPAKDYAGKDGYPTCLFYVESGGKLKIKGQDVGTSFISLVGNYPGTAMETPVDESGNSRQTDATFQNSISSVRSNLDNGNYLNFASGGMICAIGEVELQYVRLYGMYAKSIESPTKLEGFAAAIYRPAQTNNTNYLYGKIFVRDSRITNNMSSYGAAILVSRQISGTSTANTPESCSITLQNVDISSNITTSSSDGGAIRTSPAAVGSMYITDCMIYRNYAYGSGGAIFWDGRGDSRTKLKISGGSIERNHSQGHGAGLMAEGSIEFEKSPTQTELAKQRCQIINNVADSPDKNGVSDGVGDGGGLYLRTKGVISYTNTSIVNFHLRTYVSIRENKASNGGGVAVHLVNESRFPAGSNVNLFFEGLNVSGNIAAQKGGGIYLLNDNTSNRINLILANDDDTNSTIKENTAMSGGGIYLEKGANMSDPSLSSIKFNGVRLQGNDATSGSGGGIYSSGLNITSDLDAFGFVVSGNTCTEYGGGIYIDGADSDVSMTLSNAVIGEYENDKDYGGNEAVTGGGIYVTGATLNLNGGEIIGNRATSALFGGAGVYARNSTITVSNGLVKNNDSGTANGGGLYLEDCNSTFIGGTITGNKTVRGAGEDGLEMNNTGFGGGAYIIETNDGSSSFVFEGETLISENSACSGAGILLNGGDFDMTGGRITNNTSDWYGGAICVIDADSFDIASGDVTNNTTTVKSGGAIYFAVPDVTMNIQGGNISHNSSGNVGGGIFVREGSLTITDGTVSNNTSAGHGGGIAFESDGGTMTVNGGVISNNSANMNAGGINITSGTLRVVAGKIHNNTAVAEGGGICMRDEAVSTTISGGEIYSNRANLGGGIHLETNGTMLITNGEIYGNECSFQGGGLNIERSGGVTIENGTIRNNISIHDNNTSTSGYGGGIFLGANGGSLVLEGGTIKENTGYSGAGVYMAGGNCTINGGTISENNAGRNGGAFYMSGGTRLDITDGHIENNIAANMGGGIVVDCGSSVTVNISGGNINANTAPLGGGLVASKSGSVVNMTGGEICNNTARVGGGAYLSNNSTLNFGSGIIVNNKAIRMDDVTDATTGWYAENVAELQYQGVGGGVCVANAKLLFDLNTTIGLYGNQADLLGDDIYSTGRGGSISVTLPCVKDMDLTGYQAATTDLQWMEDYANGDTGYANGTKVNTAQGYVPKRYRQALADKENVFVVDIPEGPEGGKTFTGTYLALALGYDIMHLTIQRHGLMKGENAIYKVSKKNAQGNWETYAQVLVCGSDEATTPELAEQHPGTRTIAVYAGEWRAEEIGWDWAYEGTPAIERELSSATPKEDRYFVFSASKMTDISQSQHSESVVINDFGRGTVVTQ